MASPSEVSYDENDGTNDAMQLKTNGNNKRKNEKKSDKTKWSDDEVKEFIELLEELTCLWDIHSKEYSEGTEREGILRNS